LLVRSPRGSLTIKASATQLLGDPLFWAHRLPSAFLFLLPDVLPRLLILGATAWIPRRNLNGNA
jgi:hypothetical protein